MQYLRMAASVVIFGLAALGWLRMPRNSIRPILLALSIAPFSLILVQSYGGEVAIRCFLYASPVLAPLAALVVLPLFDGSAGEIGGRWARGVSAVLVFFALGVWVVTDRGLNVSFEHTTPEELRVSQRLVEQLDYPTEVAFWGQGAIFGIGKTFQLDSICLTGSAEAVVQCTVKANLPYLVVSDQDVKFLQYRSAIQPDVTEKAVAILLSQKGFKMIYEGSDIRVFKQNDAPSVDFGATR
jgi:hypothetical protein